MKRILHIISSPRNGQSISIQLGDKVIEKLLQQYPGSTVTVNNVVDNDYDHLSVDHVTGYLSPADQHTPEQKAVIKASDEAVEELLAADLVVISLPIYNFNLPSALKAWIDHIIRAGKTFSYATGRPEGLLNGKKAYLAIASSGVYSDGPMKEWDHAEPYLRFILGFIGLRDVTTFRVEGLNFPGIKETALEKGLESVVVA